MVARAKKKTKKKTAKKRVVKTKKAPAKKGSKSITQLRKEVKANEKAQWAAYKELQARVDKAWARLKANVKKNASPVVLIRDKNELLLLLGECNYMSRECMRLNQKKKRR